MVLLHIVTGSSDLATALLYLTGSGRQGIFRQGVLVRINTCSVIYRHKTVVAQEVGRSQIVQPFHDTMAQREFRARAGSTADGIQPFHVAMHGSQTGSGLSTVVVGV